MCLVEHIAKCGVAASPEFTSARGILGRTVVLVGQACVVKDRRVRIHLRQQPVMVGRSNCIGGTVRRMVHDVGWLET